MPRDVGQVSTAIPLTHEIELKFLGQQRSLYNVFERVVSETSDIDVQTLPPYLFRTWYLDTQDMAFESCDLSVRHRGNDNGYKENSEVKGISGLIGDVTARPELKKVSPNFRQNIRDIMARDDYPSDAPQVDANALKAIFAISAQRIEHEFKLWLPSQNLVKVEAAFDLIEYEKVAAWNKGASKFNVRPVSTGFVEHELELELKPINGEPLTDRLVAEFRDYALKHYVRGEPDVKETHRSKALRARDHITPDMIEAALECQRF